MSIFANNHQGDANDDQYGYRYQHQRTPAKEVHDGSSQQRRRRRRPEYQELVSQFEEYPGARSIIVIDVDRISDSCGYSVPYYDYKGERDVLLKWAQNKGDDGVEEYQRTKNHQSLDGLKGVE